MACRHILLGLIFYTTCFIKVNCQIGGMMSMMTMIPNMVNDLRESQARSRLTRTVKFVIGDTATPSPEMVNFAVIAGASPSTQAEKDAYLEMMKSVARKTPEVVAKFTKTENGNPVLDGVALDAHIMKRAMQYDSAVSARKTRQQNEEEQARAREIEMLKMAQQHELSMMGIIGDSLTSANNSSGLAFNNPDYIDPLFGGMTHTVDPFAYDISNTQNMFADPFADLTTFNQPVTAQDQQVQTEGQQSQAKQSSHPAESTNTNNVGTNIPSVSPDGTISLMDVLRLFEQRVGQNTNQL